MPISVYRLNTKIRSTMICLSFELYFRWMPLTTASKIYLTFPNLSKKQVVSKSVPGRLISRKYCFSFISKAGPAAVETKSRVNYAHYAQWSKSFKEGEST